MAEVRRIADDHWVGYYRKSDASRVCVGAFYTRKDAMDEALEREHPDAPWDAHRPTSEVSDHREVRQHVVDILTATRIAR